MNNRRTAVNLLMIILVASLFQACNRPQVTYPEELAQLHKNVTGNIYESPANPEKAQELLSKMLENGSWENIDYTSKERGSWPPREHISNLLVIAKAYNSKGNRLYDKKKVSEKIHLGLNFWLENDFQCPNWWYPEIGVPMVLAPVMLLMEPELSAEQLEKGIAILNRSSIGMTGQNKVWQSGNVLLRSLLLKDAETIAKAAEAIREELVVSTGEGVQHDWSYHQHGPQLQFGNYGLAYVGDMIKWITILRNTPFSFDESKMSILRNYLLEGQQWVTWKNHLDISACGRQLFPEAQAGKAESLALYFVKMESLDPEFADAYKSAGDFTNLTGNRHFWRSDIQVQRTPEYYFSVKMCSERVIGAESCNAENIQGYYMGDGASFLYRTNEEYLDIFPFWDWKKIPGTTTHQDNDTLPVLTARGYRIPSHFVGGVSDGANGVAVMDYNRNGLLAQKSWFMFNDMIVCLGAGITSSGGIPVTTSVNQSFLKGEVTVGLPEGEKPAATSENLLNPSWILHDQTGYLFPSGGNLKLETGEVEGSWHWVTSRYPDNRMKARLFRLWFEHGASPAGQSYAYALLPGATAERLKQYETAVPFRFVNRKDRQEVIMGDGNLAGIVFYKPGKSELWQGISADQPCMVMVRKQDNGIELSVSDPTQMLENLTITLDGSWTGEGTAVTGSQTKWAIALPSGPEAGKTVTRMFRQ